MGGGASAQQKLSNIKKSTSKAKFNDEYMLTTELGSGAFSVVKLGIHKRENKQVAVKIISKKKLTSDDEASLISEIELLMELDHPNIIKLYESFDERDAYYIATELIAGGELFDRIVHLQHYNEQQARSLIKCFLQTMAYIHEKGIVHRDLKPENLLLRSEQNHTDIVICDFGFAKRVSELLPNETACGTPGYVAPEILRGDPYQTEVDIWSMGVICYVLMVGYPPFYDEDQKKLFKKIKEGRYHFHEDYWSNISPEAIDLIRCMLCVPQNKRWTAKQLLEHPYLLAGDEELGKKDLSGSLVVLKKFNVRRRFRAAADAVIVSNRLKFRNSEVTADHIKNSQIDDAQIDEYVKPPAFMDNDHGH